MNGARGAILVALLLVPIPAAAAPPAPPDQTPPTVTPISPLDGDVLTTATLAIRMSFADDRSGVNPASARLVLDGVDRTADCSVVGTGVVLESGFNEDGTPSETLAEGSHEVTVTVRDVAGNEGRATVRFMVHTQPPVITILSPLDGSFQSSSTPEIRAAFSGSEIDPTTVSLVLDGVNHTDEAEVTTDGVLFLPATPLADGTHSVELTASDHFERVAQATWSFRVDTVPPQVTLQAPRAGQLTNQETIRVTGTASDGNGIAGVEVNGAAAVLSDGSFAAAVSVVEGSNTVVVRALDVAGNAAEVSIEVVRFTLPEVTITSPTDLSVVASTTVEVGGTVSDPATAVVVNGVAAVVSGTDFTAAEVPLIEGGNVLTATATDASGHVATDSIQVVRDLTPPRLSIDFPRDGARLFAPTVTVSGLVNDIVAGTVNASEASVAVNGMPATVGNRSFLVVDVPLMPGENVLTAVAVDASGNEGRTSITVSREESTVPRVALVSGDQQEGRIGSLLPEPLVVALLGAVGQPAVGVPVIFKVRSGSGTLGEGEGERLIAVTTGADGRAAARFTLGTRAGAGAQVVEASAAGFAGPIVFTATALPADPALLVVDSGDQQVGVAGQELPRPLVTVVTDSGFNRLEGIPVRFRVIEGEGLFGNGLQETLALSDSDGRVIMPFVLDPEEGIANNVVEAQVDGLELAPAVGFTASGRAAGDPALTSISGVVLDNANLPLEGVTLRIKEEPTRTAASDAQGQFKITGAPVGTVHLIVDGSTAARPGSWPDLEFVLTTIAGRDNTVGMPIFLLPLNLEHGLLVDETHGGTILLLPEVPGFALEILPGSVTFPGGSRSGVVSVTAVHGDKVPMVPNFGQQPRFIVTIQPAGARFDPPARLTLPNLEGLAPGEVTEFYSFDHDLGHFVSIGPASVSADGATVRSAEGVGILKAGWHCGGNPAVTGTPNKCRKCEICIKNSCQPDRNALCKPCDDKKACDGEGKCRTGPELIPKICKQISLDKGTPQPLPCGSDTCGDGILVQFFSVDPNCDSVDLAGAFMREHVTVVENGCGLPTAKFGPGCPVLEGNLLAGCTDTIQACIPPGNLPFGTCSIVYKQELAINDCVVETNTIRFTFTKSLFGGCTGDVTYP